jgi:hypothetical protein
MKIATSSLNRIREQQWWEIRGQSVPPVAPVGVDGISGAKERTERDTAISIRKFWMQAAGYADDEITLACYGDDPAVSIDAELKEISALSRLRGSTPSAKEMESWTNQF